MAQVAELWRYPVKSMGGERVPSAHVDELGVAGDRRFALIDSEPNRLGKKLTARQVDALLAYRVTAVNGGVEVTTPAGDRVDARSEQMLRELEQVAGRPLEMVERPGQNFDDSPLLVVNLASVRALEPLTGFPIDHRRFRGNVYLDGLQADEEVGWLGREIRLGDATLRAVKRCERCVLITYDPDSLERAPALLKLLTETHAARMGLYCEVVEPGLVAEGAECEVL